MIYEHKISINKLTDLSGGRRGYGTATGEVACFIEPLDDVTSSTTGYDLQNTYKIYIPNTTTDVEATDRLTDGDANQYTIKGIKTYTGAGGASHTEITAEAV